MASVVGQDDARVDRVPDLDRFKSVFARSVAINSQKRVDATRTGDADQYDGTNEREVIRLRQECQNLVEENRRLNSGHRGRIVSCDVQLPVENFVLQSQVDTLRWQLEQTESSLEMYRAVMEQMVLFLERTHRSLDLLAARLAVGARPQPRSNCSVPRSLSVHHVAGAPKPAGRGGVDPVPRSRSVVHVPGQGDDARCARAADTAFRTRAAVLRSRSVHHVCPTDERDADGSDKGDGFGWKKSGPLVHPSADEVPPERLSQEAFRLLRTARSLLDATGPNLVKPRPTDAAVPDVGRAAAADDEFLRQVAREFPPKPAASVDATPPPKRTESEYCFMAPSRALKPRRNSIAHYPSSTPVASVKRPGSETAFVDGRRPCQRPDAAGATPTAGNETNLARLRSKFFEDLKGSAPDRPSSRHRLELVREGDVKGADDARNDLPGASPTSKATTTVAGSVSSAEDESGFSSMSSFQEVGVPVFDRPYEEDREAVGSIAGRSIRTAETIDADETFGEGCDELASYRGIGVPVHVEHRRWSSTPVATAAKDPLTVLWV